MKINYEFMISEKFNRRKLVDLLGFFFAIMLLCIIAGFQSTSLPSSEATKENQYTVENITESTAVISDWTPEININGEPEYRQITVQKRLKQIILLSELPCISQPQTAENSEPLIPKVVDIPPASAIVPDEPANILPEQMNTPMEPEISETLSDEPVSIPDAIQEPSVEETNNQNFICSGFLCDASGKIIGCQDVSITDGVLCLPFDSACTGLGANALTTLGMQVWEIYIPANIITIEAGAFDGLTELCFIEVHPDNPVYKSTEGYLFEK